jgi:hypothetical protein
MNPRDRFTLVAIATVVLFVGRSAQAATGAVAPQPRTIAMQEYDRALNATFSMGAAPDGSAWTEVQAGELTVDKWVSAAGQAVLTLRYRNDKVSFRLTADGYSISRGRRSARLTRDDRNEDRRTTVRELMLGSPAVRAFRALTTALERHEGDTSGAEISTILDGALVAMLDGDDGAVDRLGRRATRRARANIRPASVAAQFTDCVGNYERALLFAMQDYEACMTTAFDIWWWSPIYTPLCSLEFFGRSQQYIYQFITCLAIP